MMDKTISHYRILEKLGKGVVYKATDDKFKHLIVLKFLPTELADPRQRD